MSAWVCGKRVGIDELFGSSSPTSKRARCSGIGSPEFGSGSEDPVTTLMRMFPATDPELVKAALRNSNNKIEDAKESLCTLPFGNAAERIQAQASDSAIVGNCVDVPGDSESTCCQVADQGWIYQNELKPSLDHGNVIAGSTWVDMFVSEMMSATDINDARQRAARILEAFENSISASSRAVKEHECALLKEHLQCLLSDNQILRRAVSIQHERALEQEEKSNEVQQLKLVLSQYQEQIHKLELSNYALRFHLQRAQDKSTHCGHFPPDMF